MLGIKRERKQVKNDWSAVAPNLSLYLSLVMDLEIKVWRGCGWAEQEW